MRWHWVVSIVIVPIIAAICWMIFGNQVSAIIIFFWPLWLAFRFDNDMGAFFIIAVLVYMVLMVIGLLFAGLVALATYGSIAQ